VPTLKHLVIEISANLKASGNREKVGIWHTNTHLVALDGELVSEILTYTWSGNREKVDLCATNTYLVR